MFSRPTIAANQPKSTIRRGVSLTIAANLIEVCENLDPDELERMISDIAKGSTTIAGGICKLLPKVRISTDLTRRSSAFFKAACQQGLKICSELDTEEVFINPKQCASLNQCMHKVADEYLREWQNLEHPDIWVCSSAMVDLVRCLETGLRLLRSCGKRNWKRRALLGEISTECMCIHKDLDSLLKFIVSIILGTPNERNNFELASSEARLNASEDLKHLKEHVLETFKMRNDRLLSYLKSKYGIGVNTLINSHDINMNRCLGQGSFGWVNEVEWMGQVLALKTFGTKKDKEDEQKVLSQVSHHPNIVKVIGYTDQGMLMELLDTNLRHKLRYGLALVAALDIMHQVAKAMSYLHNNNIVHRDLKPANILLNNSLDSSWSPQFVVLADFGISKDSFDTMRANTNLIGTRLFMAPELLSDDEYGHYNRKIDVYSFGVTFMNILCHINMPIDTNILLELLERLDTGGLYLKPLLRSCLNDNADLRPSFPEICNTLSFLRHQLILYDDTEAEVQVHDTQNQRAESEWVNEAYDTLLRTCGPERGKIVLEQLRMKMMNHGVNTSPSDDTNVTT